MKIKKEILTVMHETLPCYLVLQAGAKLAKRMRGHLRALQAISCISYGLLYDWPSHLREQINCTFQFRNCYGKFVLFDVSVEITLGSFGLGKAVTHKNVFARGKTLFTHG